MSNRDLTAELEAAFAEGNIRPVLLVELRFGSGTVYLNNTPFTLAWNGVQWLGAGRVGRVSAVVEGEDIQAYGVQLTLSGVDADLLSIALAERYQGRAILMRLALLGDDYTVIDDPVVIFRGRMDTMPIDRGQTATINLKAEGRLADLERARTRRYNSADQQIVYPGDTFFDSVPEMVEKQLYWGMATPAGASS